MAALGAASYAITATCPHCEHGINLTAPFRLGPPHPDNTSPTGTSALIEIDQPALERAVRIHVDHCGEHP